MTASDDLKARIAAFVRDWCLSCGERAEDIPANDLIQWDDSDTLHARLLEFVQSECKTRIVLEMDGYRIAQAIIPHIVEAVRRRGALLR